MKKQYKIISILLAMLLCAGVFSACGVSDTDRKQDDADKLVWTSDYTTIEGMDGTVNGANQFGGIFYAGVYKYDDVTGDSCNVIYAVKPDGTAKEICTLGADHGVQTEDGFYTEHSYSDVCAAPDGFWMVESERRYHFEIPDDYTGDSEEVKWQYYVEDGRSYKLKKYTGEGAETASVDISDIFDDEFSWPELLTCDGEGNVYLFDGNFTVNVFDSGGEKLFDLECNNWVSASGTDAEGNAMLGFHADGGYLIKTVDTDLRDWGREFEFSDYFYKIFAGSGDYLFYATSTTGGLYGITSEGEPEQIFDWLNCDVFSDDILDARFASDGTVTCMLCGDWESGENSIVTLKQVESTQVAQKTELTLAVLYSDYNLSRQVLDFNRSSDTHRIIVKDYSQYNTEDDYEAGQLKLNTEIIAGNVPDIISTEELPVRRYASMGLLTDLYTFMDSDPDVNREDFLPSVLKAAEVNGGLYQTLSGFGVLTAAGRTDVVGEGTGWTMDEMMACLNTQPEGTELFDMSITREDMLMMLCFMEMDNLVDWDSATCDFSGEEFSDILEFCSLFPEEVDWDSYVSETERLMSGKQMMSMMGLYSFDDVQMYEAMFGGEMTYKGFPVSTGSGNYFYLAGGLAISSTCADPEGAWKFIRETMTEEYQAGDNMWGQFPTRRDAYDAALAEAMQAEYTTDPETGEQVEVSQGGVGWGDGMYIELYAIRPEQAHRITDLINSVDTAVSMDYNILDIIREEAEVYFSGQRSAEDTVEMIQGRAGLYVSEQS
ncbi:MAG: hypothetical protein IJP23_07030 [Oscillospiraceae bacterium]|nr:hypothetical protein [Oscillospiraceae bacterium]